MIEIKKIIYLLIFTIGLFFVFYINFHGNYGQEQLDKVNNAVTNNDNEFFLKFNSNYNSNYIYQNQYIYVNEIYNKYDEEVGYNFIIKGLNLDVITPDTAVDKTVFIIEGVSGKYEVPLYSKHFLDMNVFYFQVYMPDLVKKTGNTLIKFTLKNYESKTVFEYDLRIDTTLTLEEDLLLMNQGYTQEEFDAFSKVDDMMPVYKSLGLYCVFAISLILLEQAFIRLMLIMRKRRKSTI